MKPHSAEQIAEVSSGDEGGDGGGALVLGGARDSNSAIRACHSAGVADGGGGGLGLRRRREKRESKFGGRWDWGGGVGGMGGSVEGVVVGGVAFARGGRKVVT